MSSFKVCRTWMLFLALLASSFAFAEAGKVTSMTGNAWIMQSNRVKQKAKVGKTFDSGDTLMTEDRSFMQVVFADGSKINLIGKSELNVSKFIYEKDKGSAEIDLESKGGLYNFFGGGIDKIAPEKFRLKTSNATIGIQGSTFSLHDQGSNGLNFSGNKVSLKLHQNRLSEILNLAAKGKLSGKKSDANLKENLKNAIAVYSNQKGPVAIQTSSGDTEIYYPPMGGSAGRSQTVVTSVDASGNVTHNVKMMSAKEYFSTQSKEVYGSSIPSDLERSFDFSTATTSESVGDFYSELADAGEDISKKLEGLQEVLNNKDSSTSDIIDEVQEFSETLIDASSSITSAALDLQEEIAVSITYGDKVDADSIKDAKVKAIDDKRDVSKKVYDNQQDILEDFKDADTETKMLDLINESKNVFQEGAKNIDEINEDKSLLGYSPQAGGKDTYSRGKKMVDVNNSTTDALNKTIEKDSQSNISTIAQTDAVNSISDIDQSTNVDMSALLEQSVTDNQSQKGFGTYTTESGEVRTGEAYLFDSSSDYVDIQATVTTSSSSQMLSSANDMKLFSSNQTSSNMPSAENTGTGINQVVNTSISTDVMPYSSEFTEVLEITAQRYAFTEFASQKEKYLETLSDAQEHSSDEGIKSFISAINPAALSPEDSDSGAYASVVSASSFLTHLPPSLSFPGSSLQTKYYNQILRAKFLARQCQFSPSLPQCSGLQNTNTHDLADVSTENVSSKSAALIAADKAGKALVVSTGQPILDAVKAANPTFSDEVISKFDSFASGDNFDAKAAYLFITEALNADLPEGSDIEAFVEYMANVTANIIVSPIAPNVNPLSLAEKVGMMKDLAKYYFSAETLEKMGEPLASNVTSSGIGGMDFMFSLLDHALTAESVQETILFPLSMAYAFYQYNPMMYVDLSVRDFLALPYDVGYLSMNPQFLGSSIESLAKSGILADLKKFKDDVETGAHPDTIAAMTTAVDTAKSSVKDDTGISIEDGLAALKSVSSDDLDSLFDTATKEKWQQTIAEMQAVIAFKAKDESWMDEGVEKATNTIVAVLKDNPTLASSLENVLKGKSIQDYLNQIGGASTIDTIAGTIEMVSAMSDNVDTIINPNSPEYQIASRLMYLLEEKATPAVYAQANPIERELVFGMQKSIDEAEKLLGTVNDAQINDYIKLAKQFIDYVNEAPTFEITAANSALEFFHYLLEGSPVLQHTDAEEEVDKLVDLFREYAGMYQANEVPSLSKELSMDLAWTVIEDLKNKVINSAPSEMQTDVDAFKTATERSDFKNWYASRDQVLSGVAALQEKVKSSQDPSAQQMLTYLDRMGSAVDYVDWDLEASFMLRYWELARTGETVFMKPPIDGTGVDLFYGEKAYQIFDGMKATDIDHLSTDAMALFKSATSKLEIVGDVFFGKTHEKDLITQGESFSHSHRINAMNVIKDVIHDFQNSPDSELSSLVPSLFDLLYAISITTPHTGYETFGNFSDIEFASSVIMNEQYFPVQIQKILDDNSQDLNGTQLQSDLTELLNAFKSFGSYSYANYVDTVASIENILNGSNTPLSASESAKLNGILAIFNNAVDIASPYGASLYPRDYMEYKVWLDRDLDQIPQDQLEDVASEILQRATPNLDSKYQANAQFVKDVIEDISVLSSNNDLSEDAKAQLGWVRDWNVERNVALSHATISENDPTLFVQANLDAVNLEILNQANGSKDQLTEDQKVAIYDEKFLPFLDSFVEDPSALALLSPDQVQAVVNTTKTLSSDFAGDTAEKRSSDFFMKLFQVDPSCINTTLLNEHITSSTKAEGDLQDSLAGTDQQGHLVIVDSETQEIIDNTFNWGDLQHTSNTSSSQGSAGTTNGSHIQVQVGNGIYIGGNKVSVNDVSGIRRYFSRIVDDADSQAGNLLSGDTFNALPTEQTMGRAEVNFDTGSFMYSMALDSRVKSNSPDCMVGNMFAFGRKVPTLGTTIYAPLRYGKHVVTAFGKGDVSSTDKLDINKDDLNFYISSGVLQLEDSNGNKVFNYVDPKFDPSTFAVNSSTGFYGPSDNTPSALALDINFNMIGESADKASLISSMYDFRGFEALIEPGKLAKGDTEPGPDYALYVVGPCIEKNDSGIWKVMGPVFAQGKFNIDGFDNLSFNMASMAFGGADVSGFNYASGSSQISFDAENFATGFKEGTLTFEDFFGDQGQASEVMKRFYGTLYNAPSGATMKEGTAIAELGTFLSAEPGYLVRDPSTGRLMSSSSAGIVLGSVNINHEGNSLSTPALQTHFVGGIPATMHQFVAGDDNMPYQSKSVVSMGLVDQTIYELGTIVNQADQGLFGTRVTEAVNGDFYLVDMIGLFPDTSISYAHGFLGVDGIMYTASWDEGMHEYNIVPYVEAHTRGPIGKDFIRSQNLSMVMQAVSAPTESNIAAPSRGLITTATPAIDYATNTMLAGKTEFGNFAASTVKINPEGDIHLDANDFMGVASGFTISTQGSFDPLPLEVSPPKAPEGQLGGVSDTHQSAQKFIDDNHLGTNSAVYDLVSNNILVMNSRDDYHRMSVDVAPETVTVRAYSELAKVNAGGGEVFSQETKDSVKSALTNSLGELCVKVPIHVSMNVQNDSIRDQSISYQANPETPQAVLKADNTPGPLVDLPYDLNELMNPYDVTAHTLDVSGAESDAATAYLSDLNIPYGSDIKDAFANLEILKNRTEFVYGSLELSFQDPNATEFRTGISLDSAEDVVTNELKRLNLSYTVLPQDTTGSTKRGELSFSSKVELNNYISEIQAYRADEDKSIVMTGSSGLNTFTLIGSIPDIKDLFNDFGPDTLARVKVYGTEAESISTGDATNFASIVNRSKIEFSEQSIMKPFVVSQTGDNVDGYRSILDQALCLVNADQMDVTAFSRLSDGESGTGTGTGTGPSTSTVVASFRKDVESVNLQLNEANTLQEFTGFITDNTSVVAPEEVQVIVHGENLGEGIWMPTTSALMARDMLRAFHGQSVGSTAEGQTLEGISIEILDRDNDVFLNVDPAIEQSATMLENLKGHVGFLENKNQEDLLHNVESLLFGVEFVEEGFLELKSINYDLLDQKGDVLSLESGLYRELFYSVDAGFNSTNTIIAGVVSDIEQLDDNIATFTASINEEQAKPTPDQDKIATLTNQKNEASTNQAFLTGVMENVLSPTLAQFKELQSKVDSMGLFSGDPKTLIDTINALGDKVNMITIGRDWVVSKDQALDMLDKVQQVKDQLDAQNPVTIDLDIVDYTNQLIMTDAFPEVYQKLNDLKQEGSTYPQRRYSVINTNQMPNEIVKVDLGELERFIEKEENQSTKLHSGKASEVLIDAASTSEFYNAVYALDPGKVKASLEQVVLSFNAGGDSNPVAMIDSVTGSAGNESEVITDFKKTPDLIYVSKDLFFIPSAENLKGMLNLPLDHFGGQISIQALPGLENFRDMSWGFWGAHSGSGNDQVSDGMGAFAVGTRDNLSTLADLHQVKDLVSSDIKYFGKAMGAMFDPSNVDKMHCLSGWSQINMNLHSSEIHGGCFHLETEQGQGSTIDLNIDSGTITSAVDLVSSMGRLSVANGGSYTFDGTEYTYTPFGEDASVGGFNGIFYNKKGAMDDGSSLPMAYHAGSFEAMINGSQDASGQSGTHAVFGAFALERPELERVLPVKVDASKVAND